MEIRNTTEGNISEESIREILNNLMSNTGIKLSGAARIYDLDAHGKLWIEVEYSGSIDFSEYKTNIEDNPELYSGMDGDVFLLECTNSKLTLQVINRV